MDSRSSSDAIEGPVSTLELVDLVHLENTLKAVDAPAVFGAPASIQDLDRLESALGSALPDDLRTLLRWHNGVEDLVPGGRLLTSAGIAEECSQIRLELADRWDESTSLHGLAPVLQIYDDFFMVRCGGAGSSPVYRWSYREANPVPHYASVVHIVSVISKAYQSRAFFPEYDGWFQDSWRLHGIEDEFRPALVSRRTAAARAKCSIAMDDEALPLDRLTALRALTFETSAIPTFLSLLDHHDPEVVRYSAFALGKMHVREALPALLKMLDRAPRVAADSLAKILTAADADVVGRILPLLTHADPLDRIAALNALQAIRSPEAVPAVIAMLQDPDPGLYWYAIKVLAYTRDHRALSPLRSLLARVDALGLNATSRGGSRGSVPTPALLRSSITHALDHILAA